MIVCRHGRCGLSALSRQEAAESLLAFVGEALNDAYEEHEEWQHLVVRVDDSGQIDGTTAACEQDPFEAHAPHGECPGIECLLPDEHEYLSRCSRMWAEVSTMVETIGREA